MTLKRGKSSHQSTGIKKEGVAHKRSCSGWNSEAQNAFPLVGCAAFAGKVGTKGKGMALISLAGGIDFGPSLLGSCLHGRKHLWGYTTVCTNKLRLPLLCWYRHGWNSQYARTNQQETVCLNSMWNSNNQIDGEIWLYFEVSKQQTVKHGKNILQKLWKMIQLQNLKTFNVSLFANRRFLPFVVYVSTSQLPTFLCTHRFWLVLWNE